MQRLATRILFVVAGFVLVVAVLLVTKSRSVRTEASGPAPTAADLSIKDVELQEESAGGGHWRLLADQAQVFDQEGRTALRKVRSEEHTSELQSPMYLVCRLLLEKKKKK